MSVNTNGNTLESNALQQLKVAVNQLMNYLYHDGCEINYTEICTCGLRETKKRVLELLK